MINLPLLASGRTADVFLLDERRVLRRYHGDRDAAREAEVMRHVAAHGYPAPAIFDVTGPDLVMERFDGPTMLTAIRSGTLDMLAAVTQLAVLLRQLQAVPAPDGADAPIVHMDLHPDNVLLTSRGPLVIDWGNARTGPTGLDVAMTAVIFGQASAHAAATGRTAVPDQLPGCRRFCAMNRGEPGSSSTSPDGSPSRSSSTRCGSNAPSSTPSWQATTSSVSPVDALFQGPPGPGPSVPQTITATSGLVRSAASSSTISAFLHIHAGRPHDALTATFQVNQT